MGRHGMIPHPLLTATDLDELERLRADCYAKHDFDYTAPRVRKHLAKLAATLPALIALARDGLRVNDALDALDRQVAITPEASTERLVLRGAIEVMRCALASPDGAG